VHGQHFIRNKHPQKKRSTDLNVSAAREEKSPSSVVNQAWPIDDEGEDCAISTRNLSLNVGAVRPTRRAILLQFSEIFVESLGDFLRYEFPLLSVVVGHFVRVIILNHLQ